VHSVPIEATFQKLALALYRYLNSREITFSMSPANPLLLKAKQLRPERGAPRTGRWACQQFLHPTQFHSAAAPSRDPWIETNQIKHHRATMPILSDVSFFLIVGFGGGGWLLCCSWFFIGYLCIYILKVSFINPPPLPWCPDTWQHTTISVCWDQPLLSQPTCQFALNLRTL